VQSVFAAHGPVQPVGYLKQMGAVGPQSYLEPQAEQTAGDASVLQMPLPHWLDVVQEAPFDSLVTQVPPEQKKPLRQSASTPQLDRHAVLLAHSRLFAQKPPPTIGVPVGHEPLLDPSQVLNVSAALLHWPEHPPGVQAAMAQWAPEAAGVQAPKPSHPAPQIDTGQSLCGSWVAGTFVQVPAVGAMLHA
jgi:hypothetical protein